MSSSSIVDLRVRHAAPILDHPEIGRFPADLVDELADLRHRAAAHGPRGQLQDRLFSHLEPPQAVPPVLLEIPWRRLVEERHPVVRAAVLDERADGAGDRVRLAHRIAGDDGDTVLDPEPHECASVGAEVPLVVLLREVRERVEPVLPRQAGDLELPDAGPITPPRHGGERRGQYVPGGRDEQEAQRPRPCDRRSRRGDEGRILEAGNAPRRPERVGEPRRRVAELPQTRNAVQADGDREDGRRNQGVAQPHRVGPRMEPVPLPPELHGEAGCQGGAQHGAVVGQIQERAAPRPDRWRGPRRGACGD